MTRRRVNLGSPPLVHAKMLRKAIRYSGESATAAEHLAVAGHCDRAFGKFEDAMYWRGQVVAEERAIEYGRKSFVAPQIATTALRKLNAARRAIEDRCLVGGRRFVNVPRNERR